MPITRDEIKALKNANSYISFFFERDPEPHYYIAACNKYDTHDGFGEREQRVQVACGGKLTIYRGDSTDHKTNPEYVFSGTDGGRPDWDQCWQTIARFLRPGDEIFLLFTIANSSQQSRELGWYTDELDLEVKRPDKDDRLRTVGKFHIAKRHYSPDAGYDHSMMRVG